MLQLVNIILLLSNCSIRLCS